jgi:hypothetical protein
MVMFRGARLIEVRVTLSALTVTTTGDDVAAGVATLVAVRVQVRVAVGVGAVYTLAEETDPQPVLGEMVQVTFWLVLPFTVTVKGMVPPAATVCAPDGLRLTEIADPVVGVALTSADTALSLPSEVTPAMPSTAVTTM